MPWFSGTVLGFFALTGIFGPFVAPYGQQEINLAESLQPPLLWGGTWRHPLGTDDLGRDILSRLIYGNRVAMLVSLAVVVIAGFIGVVIAIVAGYRGGRLDSFLMRTTDAALAFPVLLFAIVWVATFGVSTRNVVIILALAFWPSYARVLRSEVLRVKTMDFVTMARTMGAGGPWVVWRHVLPNIVPTLLVLVSLQLGLAIVAEGSLSFLGLGVPAPAASWGGMLADGRKHLADGWWMAVMPGVALSITVLATNLFGDWLRVNSDPTTRR
ncbi:MAG: ABC transporter permease [Acidimicrobiia bacterium]|nr:ABC transporter permease [Acidimicrobiia bacterium]